MPRSHDRSGHYCNDFIAAFARVLPKPTTPFLDCINAAIAKAKGGAT